MSKDNTKNRRFRFYLCSLFLIVSLSGIKYLSLFNYAIPFTSYYHSWLEQVLEILLFCFGLIICYTVTIDQYKNKTRALCIGNVSVLVTAIGFIVICIYHFLYKGNPKKFVWDSMESVTPFYVQLGVLFFINFILINFIILFLKPQKLWVRISNLLIAIVGLLFIVIGK